MATPSTAELSRPASLHPNATADLLLRRRSLVVANQVEPGPNRDDLETILRCAVRVPDHGKLAPWRIQVVQGEAQTKLGEVFAEILHKKVPDAKESRLEGERQRPGRAPLLLIVSSHIVSERVPRLEQLLSGGAVCQNILVAASALGYAGQWLSEWVSYDSDVKAHLGVAPSDEILGFLYLGTVGQAPQERPRPELSDVVSYL